MAVTVTFPDTLIWAFNPNYIEIKGATGSTAVVTVGSGSTSYDYNISLYQGSAKVNITKAIRILFSDPKETRIIPLVLSVVVDSYTYSADQQVLYAVWGCLNMGDRFASYGAFKYDSSKQWHERVIQCFVNFPFTIDLLCVPTTTIKQRKDSGSYTDLVSTPMTKAEFLSYKIGTDIEAGTSKVVIRQDANGSDSDPESTFDEKFDETFYNPANYKAAVLTTLITRNETEGVYLRWVDRFGFTQYYLFVSGQDSLKTELSSYSISDEITQRNTTFDGSRNLGVSLERSLKVSAISLDRDTLEYVKGIIASPFVDMYIGQDADSEPIWRPILVEASTYSNDYERTELQDFEITLNFPNIKVQTL